MQNWEQYCSRSRWAPVLGAPWGGLIGLEDAVVLGSRSDALGGVDLEEYFSGADKAAAGRLLVPAPTTPERISTLSRDARATPLPKARRRRTECRQRLPPPRWPSSPPQSGSPSRSPDIPFPRPVRCQRKVELATRSTAALTIDTTDLPSSS